MTDPIVTITEGRVRGVAADGICRFLGIPYAAAPVAALRFERPERAPPWSGVRDATTPGPNAPQLHRPFPKLDTKPLVGHGWRRGDDYLTVNVWTPDPAARGLPVFVFVHGGAFVVGEKDAPVHDGSAFARSGVVCVAINYRLGIEGFLPIPGAPTNLALRDQLAALAWVRENIAAFGGDPDNVTVGGESAGALCLAALVTSPQARGLCRRAILQSGHGSMVRPVDVAMKVVKRVARMLRVDADVEGFRGRTHDECLVAQLKVQNPLLNIDLRDADKREPSYGTARFLPVYGDDVLPVRPLVALAAGAASDVEVLIGATRDEMNLFQVPLGVRDKIGPWTARFALRRVEPRAWEILRAYGLKQKGVTAGDAFAAATTDLVFRLPARRYAEAHRGRAHVYEFEWASPALDGTLGACHALEMPFVFDTLPTCTGPNGIAGAAPPQELATRIHRIWVDFIRSGALPWEPYRGSGRPVFQLAADVARADAELPAARFVP
jgi:para-nitrobenzyl esterase